MKNTIIPLLCLLLAFGFSGCKDELNLKPQQSLPPSDALSSIEGLESTLNGAYDIMRSTNYYGRNFMIMADISGDDLYNTQQSNRFIPSYNYNRTAFDSNQRNLWIQAYKSILSCNSIIANIDNVDGENDVKQRIKGESLFLRALAHFDMVRAFAHPYYQDAGAKLGVPIITQDSITTTTTTIYRPYRSQVLKVYQQVVKDLSEAIPMLPNTRRVGRANSLSARALLSRVFLYRRSSNEDLQSVVSQASSVINSGVYELIPTEDYIASWGENGEDEAIFEFIFTKNDDRGANNIGRMYLPEGYGDIRPLNRLANQFGATDIRRELFKRDGDNNWYINKYPGLEGIVGLASPRVIRLAEVYLNRAEAYARLEMYQEAKADLNVILERATLGSFTPINPPNNEVLNRILTERSRELFAEGHKAFDLFRTGRTMNRYNPQNESETLFQITPTDYNSILAIPQRELDVNANLVQNPGYTR